MLCGRFNFSHNERFLKVKDYHFLGVLMFAINYSSDGAARRPFHSQSSDFPPRAGNLAPFPQFGLMLKASQTVCSCAQLKHVQHRAYSSKVLNSGDVCMAFQISVKDKQNCLPSLSAPTSEAKRCAWVNGEMGPRRPAEGPGSFQMQHHCFSLTGSGHKQSDLGSP